MKKRSSFSVLALLLVSTLLITSLTVTAVPSVSAADFEDFVGLEEIPYAPSDSSLSASSGYDYDTFEMYTEEEAAAAGVPEGYSGYVLKLTGDAEMGITIDLSERQIPVDNVASMTIRVYVTEHIKEVRLGGATDFIVRHVPSATDAWIDVTVYADGTGFNGSKHSFADLTKEDDTLGAFHLCFRTNDGYKGLSYVDSITVTMKGEGGEDDAEDAKDYFANPVGREEIPYTETNESLYAHGTYKYTAMAVYTEEEAAAAGVPEGYSGYVMMLTGSAEVGISMDLSDWNIPLSLVESMTFRVYVPSNIKEVRLSGTTDFIVRHTPSETDGWIDITVYPDGTGFHNNYDFTYMLNDNQCLGAFHFCFRYTDNVAVTAYVDGFSFELKENDGTGPVILYDGSTTVETSAGKPFVLNSMKAYDEAEERYVEPVYTWSEGALDENGLLQMGTHTCVVTFADHYGNISDITLTVRVGEVDTEAPVIRFGLRTVTATAGTRVDLEATLKVTDNYDDITPVLTWSEGALDAQNRLLVGTHTLTITATDLTGLQARKTVTFVVTDQADAPVPPTPVA